VSLYYHPLCGLNVPPSLTSSSKVKLEEFITKGKTVVKPVSGGKANSRLVNSSEIRLYDPIQGPLHLQRYVAGEDIRAHVIGNIVHTQLIKSDDIDYRASKIKEFSPHDLPDSLCKKIIKVTAEMGLFFAGWDFKLAENGEYFCLEANPMPGYDSYDRRLEWKITDSLLKALTSIQCDPLLKVTSRRKHFVSDF
jgi:glutathione synthase/RimK-type ligase-like ATP-grasp enzyme